MDITERASAFVQLGKILKETSYDYLYDEANSNPWFTKENVQLAISGIIFLLEEKNISEWIGQYSFKKSVAKRVGMIPAGNIPAVCFHDILCTLVSGNILHIKLSKDDKILPLFLLNKLIEVDPSLAKQIVYAEQFKDIDALIVTGNNNTAKHFEYYFATIPKIIRKNRTSVAIINEGTSEGSLQLLGKDIFTYFGLGCRNVSKIYIPKEYDLSKLIAALFPYGSVIHNQKYANNYEYNRTIYLMNGEPFLDNNFLLLKESKDLVSPIAVLYYERYTSEEALKTVLEGHSGQVQCVVTDKPNMKGVPFGATQRPSLWDYADGIDTMKFLTGLGE